MVFVIVLVLKVFLPCLPSVHIQLSSSLLHTFLQLSFYLQDARRDLERHIASAIQSIAGQLASRLPASNKETMAVSSSFFGHDPLLIVSLEANRNLLPRSPFQSTTPQYFSRLLSRDPLPDQDQCYLCPGNKRAQGDVNPKYENTFVFVNDYSAVKESQAEYVQEGDPKGQPISLPGVTFCAPAESRR